MSKNKISTPSVLAFERCIDCSDAVFSQKSSNENLVSNVKIDQKSVKGTISNRLKKNIAEDSLKLDNEIQKSNLQTIDIATMDYDKDILVVKWSCKILPFSGKPCVCNNIDYQEEVEKNIKEFIKSNGITSLAKRYAINILNGRWLWRNRMAAENISISIYHKNNEIPAITVFDANKYKLNSFDYNDKAIEDLTKLIEEGFLGELPSIFDIEAQLKVGKGQEVYPSQELILEKGQEKSRVLFEKHGQAAMHSQKIGNAIRTIDTWYNENAQFPISIEPYGSVPNLGHAFRQTKEKLDFYSLFDKWILTGNAPTLEQKNYVIAVLIRGGVFGASGKE